MSRFFDLVTKPARDMTSGNPPVSPAAARPPQQFIKLDSNENPYGPSALALEAMRAATSSVAFYPDDEGSALRRKLAEHHAIRPEQVLVTAGSTGMLSLLCQTLLGPGLNAVTSERSFIVYAMAVHAAGAGLVEVAMRENVFDLDAILASINSHTRIVFIANPNNPTGTMLEAAEIERWLARIPRHVVVVLDEAYYEYAAHFAKLRRVSYSNSLDYVRQSASVVVLRTFSKAYGLAGLRIGYGLGPPELLGYCARMRNTFSVSSVAQAAALAALDDPAHIRRAVESNAMQSRELTRGLCALRFQVVQTSANFIFCDLGQDASAFASRLLEAGVAVRPMGAWGAPDCIRITIGKPEDNRAFLDAAKRVADGNLTPPDGGAK
jgi:histidinol-phosphate aminotransferase